MRKQHNLCDRLSLEENKYKHVTLCNVLAFLAGTDTAAAVAVAAAAS